MGKPLADLRILLLQAREEPEILLQEQVCFQERCRITPAQLQAMNVLREPLPRSLLDDFDALMIGGSGAFSAVGDNPWTNDLLGLVRAACDRRLPTFGSCWGHQVIARALGGTVLHDPARAEFGCGTVQLTDAGRRDPLLHDFPNRFFANMGHHDRVAVLPPGGVELAFNESQRNQAFRIEGLPVYGTQFHSELDAARERERLFIYRQHYAAIESDAVFQRVLDGLAETTEVDHLMHDFLVTYAAGG